MTVRCRAVSDDLAVDTGTTSLRVLKRFENNHTGAGSDHEPDDGADGCDDD